MNESILNAPDNYYEKQELATKECLLALKSIILSVDKNIVHIRKYRIPFFCYNQFNIGFLWVNRKKILIGFVEDKKVLSPPSKGRKKDNVWTLEISPLEDIPIDSIKYNFSELIKNYTSINDNKNGSE